MPLPPVLPLGTAETLKLSETLQEEGGSIFFIPSHQVFADIINVSPELSPLQALQPKLSQPFLVCQMLQSLNHRRSPSLDLLQDVHVFPILVNLRTSEWHTAIQTQPHQCRAERKDHLYPCYSHVVQDAVGFLCCASTVLACAQLACQDPKILLCRAAFQPETIYPVSAGAWVHSSPGAGLCISCG